MQWLKFPFLSRTWCYGHHYHTYMCILAFSIVHFQNHMKWPRVPQTSDPTLLHLPCLRWSPRQGWCNQEFCFCKGIRGTAWEVENLGHKVVGNSTLINLQIHFGSELQLLLVFLGGFFGRMVLNDLFGSFVMPPSHAEAVIPGEQEFPSDAPRQGRWAPALLPPRPQIGDHLCTHQASLAPSHSPHASLSPERWSGFLTYILFLFFFFSSLKPHLTISSWRSELFHTGMEGDLKQSCCVPVCVREEKGWNEYEKSNQQ